MSGAYRWLLDNFAQIHYLFRAIATTAAKILVEDDYIRDNTVLARIAPKDGVYWMNMLMES